MNFAIISDSTCDLNDELRAKYDIDYAPMNYVIDDKEYPAMLNWQYHSPKEFYDLMRNGTRITTTQVPREVFIDKFSAYLKEGKDVLYISCSSALSGSYNLATLIAKELMEEYPDNKIYCIDSLISSFGQGGLAIMASQLRAEGKTIEEVASFLTENRLKMNQVGTCDTLEYLRRAGRVKASKAFFGNLFGVKPIIISDIKGQNYAFKKAKGSLNAKRAIVEHLAEVVEKPEDQILYISHGDDEESAIMLRDLAMEQIPFAGCHIGYIAPIVGSCVGPGTIIGFCYGKEVTIKGDD